MKPVIAINVDVRDGPPPEAAVHQTYIDSVIKSGGTPLLVPPMPLDQLDSVLSMVNGVVFVGGRDYNPARYNQELDDTAILTHKTRDDFDFGFVDKALKQENLPILGICLGAQLLNVHLGGDLVQDIPKKYPDSKIEHASPNGWEDGFQFHPVRLNKPSKLYDIFKQEEIPVQSSHHQSIDKVGKGLNVVSQSKDGVIEAVELEDNRFVIGVQWHPERGYDVNKPLFDEFVKTSSNGKH